MAAKQKRFSLVAMWRAGQIWAVAGDVVQDVAGRMGGALTDEQIADALKNVQLVKKGSWDLRPALADTTGCRTVGDWMRAAGGMAALRDAALSVETPEGELDKEWAESVVYGGGGYSFEVEPNARMQRAARVILSRAAVIELYLSVAPYTHTPVWRTLCPLCWRLSSTREGGLCAHHHRDRVLARRDERALEAAGGWRSLSQVRLTNGDIGPLSTWDELLISIDWQAPAAYQQLPHLAPMQVARAQQQGIDRILLLPWRARRAVLERARRRLVLYQACRRLARERLEATHTPGETRGQVVELILDGVSQAEIARRLGVSRQRVSVLVKAIREEGE